MEWPACAAFRFLDGAGVVLELKLAEKVDVPGRESFGAEVVIVESWLFTALLAVLVPVAVRRVVSPTALPESTT